jgi:diguanylate cyclase (GGDEF)-like protein
MSHDQTAKATAPAVGDRRHEYKGSEELPKTMEEFVEACCRRFRVTRSEDLEWLNHATSNVRSQYDRYKQEAVQAIIEGLQVRFAVERDELVSKVGHLEGQIRGISDYFEKLVAHFQDRIRRDDLTGLYNIAYLLDRLDQLLGMNLGRQAALAKIDATEFKFYNDEPGLGHHVGDEVLKAIAQTMMRSTRQKRSMPDICVRRSGDEFIIFMPDIASVEEGYLIAKRFKEVVRSATSEALAQVLQPEEMAIIETRQPVDVDVGLAFLLFSDSEEEMSIRKTHARQIATEWIIKADLMMYEAKKFQSARVEPIFLRVAPHDRFILAVSDYDSTVLI